MEGEKKYRHYIVIPKNTDIPEGYEIVGHLDHNALLVQKAVTLDELRALMKGKARFFYVRHELWTPEVGKGELNYVVDLQEGGQLITWSAAEAERWMRRRLRKYPLRGEYLKYWRQVMGEEVS